MQAISVGGAAPLVRVTFPRTEPWILMKAFSDLGAVGVIVPLINTRAEAERAGRRVPLSAGRSCAVSAGYETLEAESRAPACRTGHGTRAPRFVMIETLCTGRTENIDEIAQYPGLDGVFIGPHADPRRRPRDPARRTSIRMPWRGLSPVAAPTISCVACICPIGARAREAAENGFG